MEALMKTNVKELAQSIMALMPGGEVEAEVPRRKKAMDGCVQALKIINNLSYRVSDLTANEEARRTIKRWNAALLEGLQRLQLALRDVSGLIPSIESIQELKASCTDVLSVTKQLSTSVYAALVEPDFGTGIVDELSEMGSDDSLGGGGSSPSLFKPASPFEAGSRKSTFSPFDTGKTGAAMSPFDTGKPSATPALPLASRTTRPGPSPMLGFFRFLSFPKWLNPSSFSKGLANSQVTPATLARLRWS